MDWLGVAAAWLRRLLAQQSWLEGLQPTIAQAPDWALIAAGPAFLLLLVTMVSASAPRGARRVEQKARAKERAPPVKTSASPNVQSPPATPQIDTSAAGARTTPASGAKDFFISRAGADADSAAWVAQTLEAAG